MYVCSISTSSEVRYNMPNVCDQIKEIRPSVMVFNSAARPEISCAVSSRCAYVSTKTDEGCPLPDNVTLVDRDGECLSDVDSAAFRSLVYLPLYGTSVSSDVYQEIHHAVMDFAVSMSTHSSVYSHLQVVKPYSWISFTLYESYALSSTGQVYLSVFQISDWWDTATLKSVLKFKGERPISLSIALANKAQKHFDTLTDQTDKTKSRYYLINRDSLHKHYRDRSESKVPKVAFYPYHVLKSLGLPEIEQLDALETQGGAR